MSESATLKHPDVDGLDPDCGEKFNRVLRALLNRNFTINNDVYLEMIVSHLGEHRNLLKSAEMFTFLDEALGQWESETLPAADVAAFTLQVLAMIVGDEWNFARVQGKKWLDRFQDCVGRFQHPSVKLGHVLVLKAVSQHAMGLAWIKSSGSWRICLDYYNGQLQTIYY